MVSTITHSKFILNIKLLLYAMEIKASGKSFGIKN
jgi:hypothetical protein